MQDLLGLPIEFGARLPEDGKSKAGFRNDGDALRMSPLQYETYLQIADEASTEAIVTGQPPVVHRYRIRRGQIPRRALPKPADRPGESFDYASRSVQHHEHGPICQVLPAEETDQAAPNPYPPDIAAALGDRAFLRGGRQGAKNSVALRMHQAFRKGETLIKVRAARVEPKEGADAPASPS